MSESKTHLDLTLLYIDDHQDSAYMLSQWLERFGVTCITSTKSLDTIDLIMEHQPDLILLEINMPYMSGFEVLRHIRANEAIASSVVWAFTANSTKKIRQTCLDAGFDGFLAKPIMRKDIEAIIERFGP